MHEGIQETTEAIEGILELGLVLWRTFGDGAQLKDIADIMDLYKNDPEFIAKMAAAYDGYKKISSEIKDLEAEEIVALGGLMLSYVPRYLAELKRSGETLP